ncbi:MAG TPA: TatD family hydrolase [Dehalococcoidia bacterium]|jgi:TatD DNase family protein|nr:TatD family hydrolase [Dehalococcoidia bacterium]
MTEYIDTHAHLQEPEFAADTDAVVERAADVGVATIVSPAVDLASARAGIELARRHGGVFTTAGYHPHEASGLTPEALVDLETLLGDPAVVAVGEIGLDRFRVISPVDDQVDVFGKMLRLAGKHTLPIVVHCRDAWEDAANLLAPWAREVASDFGGQPLGVMHYFTGTQAEAERYIDLGFLISIHTSVTHPKASALRDVVARLPLTSLVIETDSPYGAPQAVRGKRNEPAYVVEAAKQIAQLQGVALEKVAEATSANARRLFRLPVPASVRGGVR